MQFLERRVPSLAAGVLAVVLAASAAGQPLGTAFTYQGRLSDAGVPASASYDMQLKLFGSAAGADQVGGTISLTGGNAVALSAGLFTVSLDFGSAFAGNKRWLETSKATRARRP